MFYARVAPSAQSGQSRRARLEGCPGSRQTHDPGPRRRGVPAANVIHVIDAGHRCDILAREGAGGSSAGASALDALQVAVGVMRPGPGGGGPVDGVVDPGVEPGQLGPEGGQLLVSLVGLALALLGRAAGPVPGPAPAGPR